MEFHDYPTRVIRGGYPHTRSSSYGGWLDDALKTVKDIVSPSPPTPPGVVPPALLLPTPPLFSIGGFAVTPVKLAVGVVAAGAIYYFYKKRRK